MFSVIESCPTFLFSGTPLSFGVSGFFFLVVRFWSVYKGRLGERERKRKKEIERKLLGERVGEKKNTQHKTLVLWSLYKKELGKRVRERKEKFWGRVENKETIDYQHRKKNG